MLALPEQFVEHAYPEEVELEMQRLILRHEVGEEAHVEVLLFLAQIENPELLQVLEAGVDGHVQVRDIALLDLEQLLQELRVFLALGHDVGVLVGRVAHDLGSEIHY